FKIPSRYAGKKVKCPGCQGPLSAPAAAKTAARGASAQRSPLPTLQPVDDDFEDYDDYDDYSEIDAYDDFGGAHADTALPRGLPPRLRREESQIQVERRRRAVTPFSETRLGAWLTNSRFVGGLGTMFVSGGIFAWGWMMGYIYT